VTMETELPELFARRNERFTFHSARMRMTTVSAKTLAAMDSHSDRCAVELADADCDAPANAFSRALRRRPRIGTCRPGSVPRGFLRWGRLRPSGGEQVPAGTIVVQQVSRPRTSHCANNWPDGSALPAPHAAVTRRPMTIVEDMTQVQDLKHPPRQAIPSDESRERPCSRWSRRIPAAVSADDDLEYHRSCTRRGSSRIWKGSAGVSGRLGRSACHARKRHGRRARKARLITLSYYDKQR
jgi:hypothetical protein